MFYTRWIELICCEYDSRRANLSSKLKSEAVDTCHTFMKIYAFIEVLALVEHVIYRGGEHQGKLTAQTGANRKLWSTVY